MAGTFCNFPSNAPLACNEGTDASAAGMFTCESCAQNKYYNKVDKLCKELKTDKTGYQAIHGIFDPEKCVYGTYSDATTLDDNDAIDCKFVENGKYCDSACKGAADMTACPTGYWCSGEDGQIGAIHKYPCPPGYKARTANA